MITIEMGACPLFVSALACSLRVLLTRRRNEAPPRPPKGLLSLRDYTVVHSALELVVHWGMCPRLESGVGVFDADRRPRSRAVKLSRRVLNVCAASQRDAVGVGVERAADTRDGSDAVVDYSSAEQLASCTNAIQGIVFTPQFIPMLMPLYLPDLLAAKLQLAYRRYPTKATITTAVEATAATLKSPVAETSKGKGLFARVLHGEARCLMYSGHATNVDLEE